MIKPDNKLNAKNLYLVMSHLRCPKIVYLQFLIICFFILGFVHLVQAKADLTSLVKKIQPSVVTIITYGHKNNTLNQGSGFFIDRAGLLITNYHVLEGAYYANVETHDGYIYSIDYIVAENQDLDLIKVHVDMPRKHMMAANVTRKLPNVAERVIVIGSPLGFEQSVSDGIVSSVRRSEYPTLIQITAPVSPGSSGSPVVNMKGEVIGVSTGGFSTGQNLNFAMPSKYILDLKNLDIAVDLYAWQNRKLNIKIGEKRKDLFKEKDRLNPNIKVRGQRNKIEDLYEEEDRFNRKLLRKELDKEWEQLEAEYKVLEKFRNCFRPEVFNSKLYELNLKRARFNAKVKAFKIEHGIPLKPPKAPKTPIKIYLVDGSIIETNAYLESGDTVIIFTDSKRIKKIKKTDIKNIVGNH